ncbi:MAG: transporter [Spirochaetota bacterium]|jgi:spore maturation protein SpmB|uniref:transporter n=1 Tax=Gracilinema caldarium TaxID=215591 RepID=UPI00169632C8|nr:transporter [Gracilinema caldarium]NLJ09440.1 transporter [Treponema sp.]
MDQKSVIHRFFSALGKAWKPSLQTIHFLLSVMIPVSLAVLALDKTGLLFVASRLLDPLMHILGLPGESSLVFLSALLLNIYSAIAVIGTLQLSLREITILAVMCLIAHNLIVESTVMRKTGSSATKMVFLRIFTALVAAFLLNYILPAGFGASKIPGVAASFTPPPPLHLQDIPLILETWALQMGKLIIKIVILVSVLMAVQKVMEEFGLLELLGKITGPFMRLLGLPPSTGFLWIVANIIGLAYGSAIMIERVETGKLSLSEGDLFNHHVGISHSLLEDTLLFMAIGVPLFWAVVPRFILAIIVVWLERGRRILFRKSFQVGTL